MSLDRTLIALELIAASLQTIATAMTSGIGTAGALGAVTGGAETAGDTTTKRGPGRPKKEDAAAPTPTSTPAASTPAPPPADTKPADTKPAEVTWAQVLEKITALNKSKEPGHGREGVLAVIAKFGTVGEKVPTLEKVGKHAEILAFVENMLNPKAADPAEDDLGL